MTLVSSWVLAGGSRSSNVGVIIGSIGGAVVLIIVAIFFLLCKKKKKGYKPEDYVDVPGLFFLAILVDLLSTVLVMIDNAFKNDVISCFLF